MIYGILIACAGLVMIYGTHRGWGWLVDPSEHLWMVYPLSAWKVVFGKTGLPFLTFALGVLMVLSGVYTLAEATI